MADAYIVGPTLVNDTDFLDVHPGAGIEVVLNNIWHEGDIELHVTDGVTDVSAGTLPGPRMESRLSIHVRNGNYMRLKNVAGSAKSMRVDGMVTKAPAP